MLVCDASFILRVIELNYATKILPREDHTTTEIVRNEVRRQDFEDIDSDVFDHIEDYCVSHGLENIHLVQSSGFESMVDYCFNQIEVKKVERPSEPEKPGFVDGLDEGEESCYFLLEEEDGGYIVTEDFRAYNQLWKNNVSVKCLAEILMEEFDDRESKEIAKLIKECLIPDKELDDMLWSILDVKFGKYLSEDLKAA